MRVFIAGLCHETSSFSPIPTSRRSFEEFDQYRPIQGAPDDAARALNGYGAFVRCAEEAGDLPVLSTYSFAQPSGPMGQADYLSLRDEILDDLRAARETDAVLLFLHGAQMAEGCDDCEGDLLAEVRAIVGPDVFVGALLDLHANVSSTMLQAATVLVACRMYPHVDFDDRAEHLYEVARRTVAGEITPVQKFRRVPMLTMAYTTAPRMADLNDDALRIQQQDGITSVSMIHGFPWADVPFAGAGVLIVCDSADQNVDQQLTHLGKEFFELRDETPGMRVDIDAALDRIEATNGEGRPLVIADVADNAGGGAPSDSTFILTRILERGIRNCALALLWDPVAVRMAFDMGEGGGFHVRIGGKCGPSSGNPVDVFARVRKLGRNLSQIGIGYKHPIGDAALLEIEGNLVVICTERGQVFSPTCFTDLGVDLGTVDALVVKSTQHFHAQFAPIGREVIYCESPGTITLALDASRYTRVSRPIWPFDEIETA